jgi:hypothetical protein
MGRRGATAAVLGGFAIASLALAAPPAGADNIARLGYYWKNNSLPYSARFAYTYDVAVHPEGVFADEAKHSFVYVTAENKHILWNTIPYGVEAVIRYGYDTDNRHAAKQLWIAQLNDSARFTSWHIASDADERNSWLGPSWNLSSLQRHGYFAVEADASGQYLDFLRIRQETVAVGADAANRSTWENRILVYNFTHARWDLKASNRFTVPASRSQVRSYTKARGSGIWAGILEIYADSDPRSDRPPVKKLVYMNRSVQIGDGERPGVRLRSVRLDASDNNWVSPRSPYTIFSRSTPVFTEWEGGSVVLHDVTARLSNGDDRQTIAVNDIGIGSAGYAQQRTFHLGRLGGSDTVTFADTNITGGYSWGFDLDSDGRNVFHDFAGTVGVSGANGNDQSRQSQIVHQVDVHPTGFPFTRLAPLPPPRVGGKHRPSSVLASDRRRR